MQYAYQHSKYSGDFLSVSSCTNITFTAIVWHWLEKQTQFQNAKSLARETDINLVNPQACNYKPSTVKEK